MVDTAIAALMWLAHGLRHALEPDHVAALATLVVGRASSRATVAYAAAWGLGHGVVLVVLGGACALLGAALPGRLAECLEIAVAVMLLGLGARSLLAARATAKAHVHVPQSAWHRSRRPLVVGCVHGLAGTGAIVAMAVAGKSAHGVGIASIAGVVLYAAGAAGGMMFLAGACGPGLARIARMPRAARVTSAIAGIVSIGIGVVWGAKAILAVAHAG